MSSQKKVFIVPFLLGKVSAGEAMLLFKTAEEDMFLRNCDNALSLFLCIFSDSEIAQIFTMGKAKLPMFFKMGWDHCRQSDCAKVFSIQNDETTTNQRQKQMDLLLYFLDKNTNYIVTKHLGSFYFGRTTSADHTSMLTVPIREDRQKLDEKMI